MARAQGLHLVLAVGIERGELDLAAASPARRSRRSARWPSCRTTSSPPARAPPAGRRRVVATIRSRFSPSRWRLKKHPSSYSSRSCRCAASRCRSRPSSACTRATAAPSNSGQAGLVSANCRRRQPPHAAHPRVDQRLRPLAVRAPGSQPPPQRPRLGRRQRHARSAPCPRPRGRARRRRARPSRRMPPGDRLVSRTAWSLSATGMGCPFPHGIGIVPPKASRKTTAGRRPPIRPGGAGAIRSWPPSCSPTTRARSPSPDQRRRACRRRAAGRRASD